MNCPNNLLAAPVGVAQLIKVDALAQSRAPYYGEYVTYSLSKRPIVDITSITIAINTLLMVILKPLGRT